MTHPIQYLTLTDNNFQVEVLEAEIPVLVDCWATWCYSNSIVSSAIHALATDFIKQIKISRLNVAEFERLSTRYRIRAVPTLLIFNNGQVVEQVVGGIPQETIANTLNKLLQAPRAPFTPEPDCPTMSFPSPN